MLVKLLRRHFNTLLTKAFLWPLKSFTTYVLTAHFTTLLYLVKSCRVYGLYERIALDMCIMTYEITSIHIQVHYPIGAGCIILLYYKLHAHSFVLTSCRYHPEPVGHFQKLENLTIAFKFMTNMENMQLVNIGKYW